MAISAGDGEHLLLPAGERSAARTAARPGRERARAVVRAAAQLLLRADRNPPSSRFSHRQVGEDLPALRDVADPRRSDARQTSDVIALKVTDPRCGFRRPLTRAEASSFPRRLAPISVTISFSPMFSAKRPAR